MNATTMRPQILSPFRADRRSGGAVCVLGLLLATRSVPARAAEAGALSLAEALAIALANNPRLRAAGAAVTQAAANVREARSAGLPNAGLQVGGALQGPEAGIRLPNGQTATFQPDQTAQAGISGQIPLDLNGRVRASTRAARRGEVAAAAARDAERQSLIRDVASAYLEALEADELGAVAVAQVSQAELRRRFTSVRLAAGTVTGLEALAAQTDVAGAREARTAADAAARQARGSLNTLLGRNPELPVQLERPPAAEPGASVLAAARAAVAAGPEESVRALRAVAEAERPDLRAATAQVAQARDNVRAARAGGRPGLALSWSYLMRRPATLLGGHFWSVGLSVLQSLFDGGKTAARVAAARAGVEQRQAQAESSRLQIANQVQNSWLQLRAAGERAVAAEAQEAQAAEAARQVGVSFDAGTRTTLDLATARTAWLNGHAAAVRARYEAARARIALAYATGAATTESASEAMGGESGR